jgi:hypothetical protein
MDNKYCFYQSDFNSSKTQQKIWYNHYMGNIVRNIYDQRTNRIIQEKMVFNSPLEYNKQIDEFFMYKLR